MALFLIKHKLASEDVPGFAGLVDLVLLLTCIKYKMHFEFKQEAKAKSSEREYVKKLRSLLENIFCTSDDDKEGLVETDRYPADEPTDEENTIRLGEPTTLHSLEAIQATVFSLFRGHFHASKSSFHKHFALFLFDEGIDFTDIVSFHISKIMEHPKIRELVVRRMNLHSEATEQYQGKFF